jgi:Fe-S-cluster containining protein
MKNNITNKLKRTFSSLLPVAKSRVGSCNGCADCCKLPTKCFFLVENEDGTGQCGIYTFRPLVCRKYPRVESEFITPDNCGFSFTKTEAEVEAETAIPATVAATVEEPQPLKAMAAAEEEEVNSPTS